MVFDDVCERVAGLLDGLYVEEAKGYNQQSGQEEGAD
jgi:hypothetical protein